MKANPSVSAAGSRGHLVAAVLPNLQATSRQIGSRKRHKRVIVCEVLKGFTVHLAPGTLWFMLVTRHAGGSVFWLSRGVWLAQRCVAGRTSALL